MVTNYGGTFVTYADKPTFGWAHISEAYLSLAIKLCDLAQT